MPYRHLEHPAYPRPTIQALPSFRFTGAAHYDTCSSTRTCSSTSSHPPRHSSKAMTSSRPKATGTSKPLVWYSSMMLTTSAPVTFNKFRGALGTVWNGCGTVGWAEWSGVEWDHYIKLSSHLDLDQDFGSIGGCHTTNLVLIRGGLVFWNDSVGGVNNTSCATTVRGG